jgi:hypothetical protein
MFEKRSRFESEMTSKRRLEAMEKDLRLAETGYEERLRDALRRCIGGQWGVFGASDVAHAAHFGANRVPSNDAIELTDRGGQIAQLRAHLGYAEPFPLHERFLAYRKIATDPNAHGEPKLARQFLDEIDRDAPHGRKA